jgi:DNA-binding transcriptional regulator YdaS (Cro superfamily)
MEKTDRLRVLERAMEVMGGTDALARELLVSSTHLQGWLNGEIPVPQFVLLGAITIIGGDSAPRRK